MNKIFILWHTYEYGEEFEHESTKILGAYSSQKNAEEAKNRYSRLTGFNKYSDDCFYILDFEIDKDFVWNEGFMSGEEIEHYQEENNICRGDEFKKSIFRNDKIDKES